MKARNKAILALLAAGMILFGLVHGVILPKIEQDELNYIAAQQDPLTHDIESAKRFKNKYMGNAGNLANLFQSLPLSDIRFTFQLYPDLLTAELHYRTTEESIKAELLNRALIYNATAGFALIDNLEVIHFYFMGTSYKVSRSDVEQWYGVQASSLIQNEAWVDSVQRELEDTAYVRSAAKALLMRSVVEN
ncbi:DUF4825 domain-containing protein [Paenibacillus mendelii]|uniref:DUF4825 domain-containing protein n=1 Tax=Paenibacillus mendelii TaxID=206163 RepID=A0ABV6J8U0_9BACL|nr:DUF4825 domain-containing protein [Paenibacillus mendelii]MCQ6561390.1 DUF4825 domain-containing protein [Paenibacillus mendelii]